MFSINYYRPYFVCPENENGSAELFSKSRLVRSFKNCTVFLACGITFLYNEYRPLRFKLDIQV